MEFLYDFLGGNTDLSNLKYNLLIEEVILLDFPLLFTALIWDSGGEDTQYLFFLPLPMRWIFFKKRCSYLIE